MYKYDNELAEKQADQAAYCDYYSRLKNLASTMFKWENLPDSVNERYLEYCLFTYGRAVFFDAPSLGYMALNCALEGINFYQEPNTIRPITPIKVFGSIPFDECVLIRNTPDMYPTFLTTIRYAKMLYDIDRTIDVNINAQKTPVLILTDQKQKQSAMNLYQKYNGNTPVIYGNKDNYDPNSFKVLRTDAPFVAGQLQDIKITKYNEYLGFLGIGMADYKKERRIVNEVDQFDRQSNALANIGLSQRKEACKKINKLFGLNVDVKLATDAYITDGYKYNAISFNANFTKQGGITEDGGNEV
mgnify:FL=1